MKERVKERVSLANEEIIHQYFKFIDDKDLSSIIDLFDYDAVVYEPFSNITGGLRGRSSIEPFLRVAMMANSNFERTIVIEKPAKPMKATALVTFKKGGKVKGKFTFGFEDGSGGGKKIKSLRIEFI